MWNARDGDVAAADDRLGDLQHRRKKDEKRRAWVFWRRRWRGWYMEGKLLIIAALNCQAGPYHATLHQHLHSHHSLTRLRPPRQSAARLEFKETCNSWGCVCSACMLCTLVSTRRLHIHTTQTPCLWRTCWTSSALSLMMHSSLPWNLGTCARPPVAMRMLRACMARAGGGRWGGISSAQCVAACHQWGRGF